MDVTLPDGTVIQGVPDNITKAELTAKLQSNGYDVSKLGAAQPTPQLEQPKKQYESYLDHIAGLTMGGARGIKNVIDTGAELLSNLGGKDEAARVKQMNAQGQKDFEKNYGNLPLSSVGKFGGEVVSTLPIGGAFGKIAEGLKAAPVVVNALRSSGMSTGAAPVGAMAKAGDLALRTAAAGAVGTAGGAMIDPSEALRAGVISALMPGGFKLGGYAGDVVGSFLKPFTKSGQEGLVGEMLNKFSANPKEALANIKNAAPIIEGSAPTSIAASGDVGLAGLGRTLQSTSPQYANELAALQTAQNQARTKAIEDIAGNTGKVSLAKEARDLETAPMRNYVLGNSAPIDTKSMLSGIDNLMSLPDNAGKITQSALADVRKSIERIGKSGQIDPRALYAIRKDVGLDISGKVQGESGNAKFASGQLIDVKNLMDDAIDKASRQPVATNMIESNAGNLSPRPTWKQYLETYTERSKPINQMETLADVLKRIQTGTVDSQGGYVLSAAKLNNIIKNEGSDLAKKITPEQLDAIRKLSADLNASQLSMNSGKSVGSNTVQNLSGNNFLSNLLGEKIGGSVMSKSMAGRLLKLPYGHADDMMREKMGEALLNPELAAKYMEGGAKNGQLSNLLSRILPLTYRAAPAIAAQ
jgi:hypothetical protein